MLSGETLAMYKQYKQEMDAAYTVFKRTPNLTNATRHSMAVQTFNNFCVETIKRLADDTEDKVSSKTIIENIESYRTCKQCGSEVIYVVSGDHFVASGDFLPEFPGWCYTCLVEHCLRTSCGKCKITSNKYDCPFSEVKKLYQEGV